MAPSKALGIEVEVLSKYLPHAQRGRDRQGGPLIYKHMGAQCRIKQACEKDGATLDGIARYNTWLNESYTLALAEHGAREWSVVVDAAGWHIGLFDTFAFKFLKRTATTDAAHYPELLHCMIIVNAPSMLAAAWRVIRTWVDADTRAKIQIIADPAKAREALLQLAEAHELPLQYCGTAPALPNWPEKAGVPVMGGDRATREEVT